MKLSTFVRNGCGLTVSAAALAAFMCFPLPSQAQTDNTAKTESIQSESEENDVFKLGTVTFSVNVEGERLDVSEQMESSVTRSEIELFENKDIGKALSRTPGVRYGRGTGWRYESGVIVRGFSSYGNGGVAVPLFIDGISVATPYDHSMDLGRFTTNGVSTISVSKGYSSVLLGPNAIGGAINVVSQRPVKPLYGNFVFGAGGGGVIEANGIFGTLQDKWYAQVGLSHFDREFINMAEIYDGTDGNGQERYTNRWNWGTTDKKAEFKFGFIPNATDEYVVSYSRQTGEKGPQRDTSNCNVENPSCWARGYMIGTQEWPSWDRETVSFVSNTNFDSFYLKPRVFYDKYDNALYGWAGLDETNVYDDYAWGGSVEAGTGKIRNNELKGKFDYKFNNHQAYDIAAHDGGRQFDSDSKLEERIFFFAIEDTYRFNEQWEVQGGLLYSRRQTTHMGESTHLETFYNDFPSATSSPKPSDDDSWDPQAVLFYHPNEKHSFHYSIAKKTRYQSMRQQYSNYGDSDRDYTEGSICTPENPCVQITLPNPDLKPEQALHHEIGWEGNFFSRLDVSLAWYYSNNKNFIERSQVPDETTYTSGSRSGNRYAVYTTSNISGNTIRQGFDLGMEYALTDRIIIGKSFSYLHSSNKDNADWRSTQPAYNGSLYADIGLNNWVSVVPALDYQGHSRRSSTGAARWDFNQGYALVDLKLSITPPMHRNVSINIGAENLFDTDYRGWGTFNGTSLEQYPTPGRYLYANVRYKL